MAQCHVRTHSEDRLQGGNYGYRRPISIGVKINYNSIAGAGNNIVHRSRGAGTKRLSPERVHGWGRLVYRPKASEIAMIGQY